jgi:DNA-binding MarR family transcriptional regulator
MARTTKSRAALLERLHETLRRVGAQSVLLSGTVSRLVGLNCTDLECLDLVDLGGPTTAGRLAERAGLTTGAMTAVIDRLEQAGFVRRVHDQRDRRCVHVQALPHQVRQIGQLYRRLAESTARLNEDYDDRQLALVVDYLTRALALTEEHVKWLQTRPPLKEKPGTGRRRAVRRAGTTGAPRAARHS